LVSNPPFELGEERPALHEVAIVKEKMDRMDRIRFCFIIQEYVSDIRTKGQKKDDFLCTYVLMSKISYIKT